MLAVQHPTWNSSQRTTVLIGGVVLLHVLGLWALHTGLLQRATEWVIPVVMVSEMPSMAVKPPPPPPPLYPLTVTLKKSGSFPVVPPNFFAKESPNFIDLYA